MTPPTGWRSTTLGGLGEYLNGRGFRKAEWRDFGRPIIRIQNLTGSGESFNYFQGEVENRYVARPGELLVSWAATLGAYFWEGPEAVINQHIFKVESNIDRRFHKYLLDYKLADLTRHAHGSGMVHITRGRFDSVPVIVPVELGEQRRIVEILEDHLSRLDAADRDLGAARARIDLAVGMHAEWLARQAGGLQRTVAGVADFVTDGDHNPPKRVAQGVPHVTARGITSDGRIDLTSATYVTEEGYAQTSLRYRPSPGDVIVTCVGTIGRIAIVPKGVRFSADRNLAAIRPDPSQVTSEYLRIWLTSPKRQHQMRSASGSTAQPHLYLRDLRALPIDVPSLDVQESMAGQESEYGERVRRQDAAVAVTARKSAHLRWAVLAAAFEGKLTGRDTGDEVIEEMAAAP